MKQVKAIGRHRKVSSVSHKGNRTAIAPTGIMFRGCMVALMVPATSVVSPSELAKAYAIGTNQLVGRAKQMTVRDMYMMQFKAAEKLQGRMDGLNIVPKKNDTSANYPHSWNDGVCSLCGSRKSQIIRLNSAGMRTGCRRSEKWEADFG